MKTIVKLLFFGLILYSISIAEEISYDLRANIFQANVYSATDTNWTNIDVYYITNPDGWQEPNQSWGSFDRRSTSSGGVQKNSIFAHPDYEGQVSATVADYTLTNPSSISTYYGLSDNQVYNYGDVRFVIQIKEDNNYITILDSIVVDGDFWRYFEYDLSEWSNDSISIRLITDPNGGAAEDWAHWSESIVLMDHIPTTIYVSQSGNDSTGNGSVDNPYASIQWGIEMSLESDTVIVLPGAYVENINFIGKNIVVGSLFLTTQDTTYISQTIIDGDNIGTVVTFNGGEDTTSVLSGFTITNGLGTYGGGINCQNSSPTLSNLIITNNIADGYGGGINCYNSTPILRDLVVDSNTANNSGGGINLNRSSANLSLITISENYAINSAGGLDCYRSSPIITNVIIIGNNSGNNGGGVVFSHSADAIMSNVSVINNISESSGGGISMWKSSPLIEDVEISGNLAEGGGGGVVLWSSSPTLINCIISGNTTDSEGGGISCGGDSLVLINCVISGNSSGTHGGSGIQAYNSYLEINNSHFINNFGEGHGGGILLKDSTYAVVSNSVISGNSGYNGGGIHCQSNFSSSLFYNCTIVDNHTDVGGGGITVGQNSSPIFVNSIFWNDQETDVFPYNGGTVIIAYSDIQGGWEGEGNIDADPLFTAPTTADYTLQEGSPCIDAGTAFFVFESDTLVNLPDSSYNGNAPDMGAFEYGSVSIVDIFASTPNEFRIFQNYPNPFNPVTTISYQVPELSFINLSIFNINGKLVSTLVNEKVQPGNYSVKWDAKDFSSGVYFYKLVAGKYSETGKAILLK